MGTYFPGTNFHRKNVKMVFSVASLAESLLDFDASYYYAPLAARAHKIGAQTIEAVMHSNNEGIVQSAVHHLLDDSRDYTDEVYRTVR